MSTLSYHFPEFAIGAVAPGAVTDGVDAPPDGIAMCQVGGVVNAKRGRGRPWNRFT